MRIAIAVLFSLCGMIAKGQSALKTGEKAPSFSAITHSGEKIEVPGTGTIVLLFYRGYWCPYCNRQLSALNDSLSFIEAKGANVVAITPEKSSSVDMTIERTKASFKVISDTSNVILKLYNVDFKMDDKTVERYKGFGIDFTVVNANTENTLPVPAVYIIKNGIITYSWFDKDYRKRPSVKELLDHL